MKVVMALMMMYCQNHLNYKGCVDDKMACVDEYVTIKLQSQNRTVSPKVLIGTIDEAYAEAYNICTESLSGDNCPEPVYQD